MRFVIGLALGVFSVFGQTCAPSRMLASGAISGALSDASCRLSDGSVYEAYRLELPVRGRIEIDLPAVNGDFLLILRNAAGARVDSGTAIRRGVEAGTYTLLVNGSTAGQVGSYSLRSEFTAEPGMWCTRWGAIGLNQTVAGKLGATGCRMPNQTLYEAYTFLTFGAGTLKVEVTAQEFTPLIIVRSGDGAAIVSGGASVQAELDGDNRYQIVVHSSDNIGEYQIKTSFAPSSTDTCQAVATLVDAGSSSGSITPDSCVGAMPGREEVAYYNYYALTIAEAGVADLAAASGSFAPLLNLLDESGNLIAMDSRIRMQLKPGHYTVRLFSPSPAGGAYQLNYGFTAGQPQGCPSVTANLNESQAGRLTTSVCRADYYGVTLPSAGTLDVTLTGSGFAGTVAIRDAKDSLMVVDSDAQGLGASHLAADLPAGSYIITASGSAESGEYQLATSFTGHEIPPCERLENIDLNGGWIWKLGPASCRNRNGQPADYYEFTLPSDSVVAAVMTSSEVDSYLSITDVSGNALRTDDNSYGYNDAFMIEYLRAGTYRLETRAAGSSLGGYYQVDLRTIPGDRPPFCGSAGAIEMGGSVTGTIAFNGCNYPDSTFASIYSFRVTNETAVELRLESGAFDAYLVLMDSFGNVLARDDDGGGNTDARIADLLGPGTYYAIAKPLSEYVSGGAFTLSLTAQ